MLRCLPRVVHLPAGGGQGGAGAWRRRTPCESQGPCEPAWAPRRLDVQPSPRFPRTTLDRLRVACRRLTPPPLAVHRIVRRAALLVLPTPPPPYPPSSVSRLTSRSVSLYWVSPPQERLYERPVRVAEREFVEERAEEMLDLAAPVDAHVAFLVVGDPYGATTHTDLWLRAIERGIPVEVIHNASIMNAVAACGLQLYRFGEAVSLCFWTDTWKPDSYWAKIARNRAAGLHTLCLLDIKVREPSVESLARGRRVYEPPRFMTVAQAAAQLLDIVAGRGGSGGVADTAGVGPDTRCVGLARVGQPDQVVAYGRLADLADADLGPPLHSLVVPAEDLHFHEQAVVDHYALGAAAPPVGRGEPPAATTVNEE